VQNGKNCVDHGEFMNRKRKILFSPRTRLLPRTTDGTRDEYEVYYAVRFFIVVEQTIRDEI
jgi:hypothetical protein